MRLIPGEGGGQSPFKGGLPPWSAILLRALVYALAITALVLYAPSEEHVFIYQGF